MIEDDGIFRNLNGEEWLFNNDIWPLKKFDPVVDMRGNDRTRGESHGIYPRKTYMGRMHITMEGDLLADTPEDYIAARQEVLALILGDPLAAVTTRKMGTLVIRYAGMTEDMETDVALESWDMGMEAIYPSTTPFQFNWVSFTPYWTGVATGNPYFG
jgi:hypothetical protein